ncbi:unnamed protein product [Ilex paraguariensis]|uniref:Uncharacterized protein n=1 Tax=Ilex paraguariensis TaxID=185542 RepID=A0ABC8SG49_9AQUA
MSDHLHQIGLHQMWGYVRALYQRNLQPLQSLKTLADSTHSSSDSQNLDSLGPSLPSTWGEVSNLPLSTVHPAIESLILSLPTPSPLATSSPSPFPPFHPTNSRFVNPIASSTKTNRLSAIRLASPPFVKPPSPPAFSSSSTNSASKTSISPNVTSFG